MLPEGATEIGISKRVTRYAMFLSCFFTDYQPLKGLNSKKEKKSILYISYKANEYWYFVMDKIKLWLNMQV